MGPMPLLAPPSPDVSFGPRGANRQFAPREPKLGDEDRSKRGDGDMMPSPGTLIAAAMVYGAMTADSSASESVPSSEFQSGGGDFGGGGSSGIV